MLRGEFPTPSTVAFDIRLYETWQKRRNEKRERKQKEWEEEWAEKWRDLLAEKYVQVKITGLLPRFTLATGGSASSTPYYSFSGYQEIDAQNTGDFSFVFVDGNTRATDWDGGRTALALRYGAPVICLKTEKQTDRDLKKDPANWVVVTDAKDRKAIVEDNYKKFKAAPLIDPRVNTRRIWAGRGATNLEVLSAIKRSSSVQ